MKPAAGADIRCLRGSRQRTLIEHRPPKPRFAKPQTSPGRSLRRSAPRPNLGKSDTALTEPEEQGYMIPPRESRSNCLVR